MIGPEWGQRVYDQAVRYFFSVLLCSVLLCLGRPVLALNATADPQGLGGLVGGAAQDARSRGQIERQLNWLRPTPANTGASSSRSVDTIVPGVTDAAQAIDELVQAYRPSARDEARATLQALVPVYRNMEQQYRVPRNDLAGALAAFIAGAYSGYSGRSVEDAEFAGLVSQMRRSLSSNLGLSQVSMADRQHTFERLAVLGMLTLGTHVALQQSPQNTPQTTAARNNLRQASKTYLEMLLGGDARSVRIGADGLQWASAASTAPGKPAIDTLASTAGTQPMVVPMAVADTSKGPSRAIEAVVLTTAWSPGGVGGMVVMNYRPAVLYKDGSFSRDADRALRGDARIDGRWQRDGGGFVLQGSDGKSQQVQAKMRARPAAAGQTLEGGYRSLSGAGLANTGVTTVAAFNTMNFHANGRLDLAQGAGASGGGLSTRGTQAGTAQYRLDGYTITVTHDNGQREQRLFYLFPDSDRAVGVGALSLSARR